MTITYLTCISDQTIFLVDSAGICGRPRTSRGLRLHGNSYLDGDRVTFSCDKNFDLFGKAELRCVCLLYTSDAADEEEV